MHYDPATTAILLVDPYNDFLSEGGKLWPRAKAIAEEVNLLDHLRAIVAKGREKGIKIVFVPHHRWVSKGVGTGPRIGVQSGPLRKLGAVRLS